MAKGTVKWFDPKRGFGFIINEKGQDVFVHYTCLNGDGFRALREGQVVEYEEYDSGKGLQGKSVRIIPKKRASQAPSKAAHAETGNK